MVGSAANILSPLSDAGWLRISVDMDDLENHPTLEALTTQGYVVSRRTVVSSDPRPGEMRAQDGEFWFHSDGCFCPLPPRIVCIHVLTAQEGGELSVLDRGHILDAWPQAADEARQPIRFGARGQGVVAPIWTPDPVPGIFRFRRDYMAPCEPRTTVPAAAQAVEAVVGKQDVVGVLRRGEALVLDNWRLLHRRGTFQGVRRICRLWLDQLS